MSSRIVAAASVAGLMIFCGTASVNADGLMARLHAVAQACEPDIKSFCQGMPGGGAAVIRCLGANYMNVSPACRNTMASAMNDVCGSDLARLCPGSTLGSGMAESCLQSHVSELTGSCKAAANRLAAR
jgi:hypothetical protein